MQVTPSDTGTKQLSSEISEIKNWYENNARASGLVNCNAENSYIPRWDKSKDADDRIEFDTWVNAENKFCLPKVAGTGLKSGRMKFVAKKRNGNGNGNGNMQGVIVSFIPFQNFTGDITKVSTTTFRQMQFSGIIAFEEVNGCLGNAYLIDKGVVKSKLTIQSPNQITPRCGEAYITTRDYYVRGTSPALPQGTCTVNFDYSSQSTIYGVPCLDAPVSVGSSGNYGSSTGSSSDATYNDYLNNDDYVCSSNFNFKYHNQEQSIKQEGAITGVKASLNIANFPTITVTLPTIYISMNFHDVNGTVLFSPSEAGNIAARAINYGEDKLRQSANGGYYYTNQSELVNIWVTKIVEYFTDHPEYGGVVQRYQINSDIIVDVKPYVSCN